MVNSWSSEKLPVEDVAAGQAEGRFEVDRRQDLKMLHEC